MEWNVYNLYSCVQEMYKIKKLDDMISIDHWTYFKSETVPSKPNIYIFILPMKVMFNYSEIYELKFDPMNKMT